MSDKYTCEIEWKEGSIVDIKFYSIKKNTCFHSRRFTYWRVPGEADTTLVIGTYYNPYETSLSVEVDRSKDMVMLKYRGEVVRCLPLTGDNLFDMLDYVEQRKIYTFLGRDSKKKLMSYNLFPLIVDKGKVIRVLTNESDELIYHLCSTYDLYIGSKQEQSSTTIRDIACAIAGIDPEKLHNYTVDEFITICYYNGYEYTFRVSDLMVR